MIESGLCVGKSYVARNGTIVTIVEERRGNIFKDSTAGGGIYNSRGITTYWNGELMLEYLGKPPVTSGSIMDCRADIKTLSEAFHEPKPKPEPAKKMSLLEDDVNTCDVGDDSSPSWTESLLVIGKAKLPTYDLRRALLSLCDNTRPSHACNQQGAEALLVTIAAACDMLDKEMEAKDIGAWDKRISLGQEIAATLRRFGHHATTDYKTSSLISDVFVALQKGYTDVKA